MKNKAGVVTSMIKEIGERSSEFKGMEFDSLYFGGGTPSVLEMRELDDILEAVYRNYRFAGNVEFTLEANPDDLKRSYLEALRSRGVNRLSIGVQSFREEDLRLMRRSHDSQQAREAIYAGTGIGI